MKLVPETTYAEWPKPVANRCTRSIPQRLTIQKPSWRVITSIDRRKRSGTLLTSPSFYFNPSDIWSVAADRGRISRHSTASRSACLTRQSGKRKAAAKSMHLEPLGRCMRMGAASRTWDKSWTTSWPGWWSSIWQGHPRAPGARFSGYVLGRLLGRPCPASGVWRIRFPQWWPTTDRLLNWGSIRQSRSWPESRPNCSTWTRTRWWGFEPRNSRPHHRGRCTSTSAPSWPPFPLSRQDKMSSQTPAEGWRGGNASLARLSSAPKAADATVYWWNPQWPSSWDVDWPNRISEHWARSRESPAEAA